MPDLITSTTEINDTVNSGESLEGRRIIDAWYVFETIQLITHLGFNCTFQNLKFSKGTTIRYFSLFYFD
jgi:hypothetical protein